ncbi:SH3 domain-containing protein [Marimonas lutisalis]|uniref:SH3 domain-containing protein n=1 Tax=Marimonas lutisalis TaxID=2545756 RepID=UPI0010F7B024|nr:SH3 domain-containing protein [Marimonas lutisalis]
MFEAGYLNAHGLSGPLNIRESASTQSAIVTRVLAGTLQRNAGCAKQDDRDGCEIECLDASGTRGWAAAEYLQPAPATMRAQNGRFDNIGRLSCRIGATQEAQDCGFGIARDGNQSAIPVVFKPDGFERVVHFANGAMSYAKLDETDAPTLMESSVSDGMMHIRISDEHYAIAAHVVGGNGQ